MIKILFISVAIFICIQIIYQKDYKKIVWLLAGIIFFPHSIGIADTPIALTFHRLFIYTLLINTLLKKDFYYELKKMPVFFALMFLLISNLATGIFDPRLDIFLKFYRPITLFIENFFILYLAYYHIKSPSHTLFIYKKYIYFLLFFCLYGISNYITKNNQYYNLLETHFGVSNFTNLNMDLNLTRFRISSFAFHAILYGLYLALGILISFYLYFNNYIKKNIAFFISIILLIFLNLILVNSRTPILAFMAGLFILFFFGISAKGKIQLLILSFIFCVISVLFLSDYLNLFQSSIHVISSNTSDIDGSSLEMRKEQLQASINIFSLRPITGNGFEFIRESLYSISIKNMQALLGVESYLFKLLIEQGIVGIVSNTIFLLSLLIYCIKKANNPISSKISAITISLIFSFLIFILGTGALTSFPFFMILLGISLKGISTSTAENRLI